MEPAPVLPLGAVTAGLGVLIDALRARDLAASLDAIEQLPEPQTFPDDAPDCLRLRAAMEEAAYDADPAVRCAILRAVEAMAFRGGSCDPIILAGLADPDSAVREQAVRLVGLSALSPEERADRLKHALQDPDPAVRRQAVQSIGRAGPAMADSAAALRAFLNDADPLTAKAAAIALTQVLRTDRPWVGPLLQIREHRQASGSADADDVLSLMDAPAESVARWLVGALDDPIDGVRWNVMLGLAECGAIPTDEAVVLKIEAALLDRVTSSRVAAAWALCRIGPYAAPAAATLARRLEDPDPTVRELSAMALAEIGPAAAPFAQSIAHARDHDDRPSVRAAAASALSKCAVQSTEHAESP